MLKYQWEKLTISTSDDFTRLKNIVNTIKPTIGAFDTETDGLHIINCKPFLFQFGFLEPEKLRGFTFAVDLERTPELAKQVINYWHQEAIKLQIYAGQNIKFDLHMIANAGFPYKHNNLTDTTFYIRYAHDALHTDEGGPPLGLKEYATRYIDPKAKLHEHKLKKERTAIAKEYNNRLKRMLNESNAKLPKGCKTKSFTLSTINDLFKDCIFEVADLPEDIKEVYIDWLNSLPLYLKHRVQSIVESDMIRYNDLNRENLITYAHYDIIYTLEILASLLHIIENRHQETGIEIENRCILPWYEMERYGFAADKEYLEESRKKLKQYIKDRRKIFYELAGEEITVGQHPAIKRILADKYGLTVQSTGNEALNLLKNKIESEKAKQFINILQELRTLEKWYSAYIIRFQKELKFNDRLYTTINQVGTVSGRVTSDFQQFPKKPIKTIDGEELFHPRRIIKTSSAIVYLDYSQIELRFQALYTVLIGSPDFNMCRAYMPYKCVNAKGTPFDFNNPEHINNWNKEWYHEENTSEHWEPVDVHGATTTAATGLTKDDPEFATLRSTIGKRVNFAKNYGAELGRIMQMFPDKTKEECIRINDAYYKAFPGIKLYHEYCKERAGLYSNTPNLFGVRYYNVSGHKLKNLLIQGSAAYYLKLKIIELHDYMKKNNIKTKFQMQIHDELSWEYDPSDPPEIFFEFKRIMEHWTHGKIPIIADMEATTTTWAEKQEIKTLEQLKEILKC
jgi:DNA polymerase I